MTPESPNTLRSLRGQGKVGMTAVIELTAIGYIKLCAKKAGHRDKRQEGLRRGSAQRDTGDDGTKEGNVKFND